MANYQGVAGKINCVLVASGDWHDIDFARLELLKLLAEDDRVRVRVFEDYENLEAIETADFIISYTCNVMPSLKAQEALRGWVERGGRWYALHGTNSVIRMMSSGAFGCPDWAPLFMDTLGSQFLSHPLIEPYKVSIVDKDHELTRGLEPFEATDELYLMKTNQDLHVLLDTEYGGEAPGFEEDNWEHAHHPVMYIQKLNEGAVLYLTLGHCRHHYDMQPMMDYWPTIDRCSWDVPQYYELLRRGIRWCLDPVSEAANKARAAAVAQLEAAAEQ